MTDPYLTHRLIGRSGVPYGGEFRVTLDGHEFAGQTFDALLDRAKATCAQLALTIPDLERKLEQEVCRRYPEECRLSREPGAPVPMDVRYFDGFMFFNEFEMLKLRCEELKPLNHTHILVESPWTVQGQPKPLYFAERKAEFAQYHILHKVLPALPPSGDSWANERAQRNYILDPAIREQDLLILTDADEIPRASALAHWYGDCASLWMTGCQYFLNRKPHEGWWTKPKILRRGFIQHRELYDIRLADFGDSIINAGWHFSWLGGLDRIIAKLESFSHAEMNTPEWHDLDLWRRKFTEEPFLPLDSTYPKYLTEHPAEFAHLLHPL